MKNRCSRCGRKLDKRTGLCPACGRTGRPGGNIGGARDAAGEALEILKKQKPGKYSRGSGGKGAKKRVITCIAVLLAISIVIFTGLGVLAYFDKAELNGYDKIFGKMGIQRKTEQALGEFNYESGKFTDITIKDDESAISAAKEAIGNLGLKNAGDDLSVDKVTENGGVTFYRIQQNYKGIPVYGRTISVVADKSGISMGFTSNVEDIEVGSTDADLEKTDFKTNVENYLKDTIKVAGLKTFNVLTPDKSDLIIYKYQGAENAVLACRITVTYECGYGSGQLNLIFDLENGKVITKIDTISSANAVCYGPTAESGSFNGIRTDESTYVMDDTDRNIYVYNAGRNVFYDMYDDTVRYGNASLVESGDRYFGNADDKGLCYDKAYDVLSFFEKCFDFYDKNFNCRSYGSFIVVYNDDLSLDGDNAAGGSCTPEMLKLDSQYLNVSADKTIGFMDIGYRFSDDILSNVDVLAHEYSHIVTRCITDWGSSDITCAISEGYSDIFGEILQSEITGNDIDWCLCGRPIYDPSEGGYPEETDSYLNGPEDYSHGHSTCVSYAAYLMTQGVDGSYSALSVDELSKLWYSALWLLPSDCDYTALGQALRVASDVIGLSKEKQECVSAALKKVGISDSSSETYSNNITLSVYGMNGNLYNNYTVDITGKVYSGALKTGIIKKDYTNSIKVTDSSEVKLSLQRGDYRITITDNSDKTMTLTREFKVRASSTNSKMVFRTDCGTEYTIGTDTLLQVYDANNLAYGNYRIDITGKTGSGEAYSDSITSVSTEPISPGLAAGTYTCTVTDLGSSGKTVSFGVNVVKTGSLETLNIETEFGEATGKPDTEKIPDGASAYNGHYYCVYNTEGYSDYNSVRSYCESLGGYPAVITTKSENKFVRELIQKSGYSSAATGLVNKNGWSWADGEALSYENWKSVGEKGDCAVISASDGSWSGSAFGRCDAFVCEWGEYSTSDTPVIQSPYDRETSADNDTVIILDVSDDITSADFTAVSDSVSDFAAELIDGGSSVAVVTYDGSAKTVSELTKNSDQLKKLISCIGKGEVGYGDCFNKAEKILSGSSAETKNIVLITDSGDTTGEKIKDISKETSALEKSGINVYTLGIFENLNDKDRLRAISQLDRISGENRHYESGLFDDASSYLKNISGQILDGSYMCLVIKGPVDVTVETGGQSLTAGGTEENLICDSGTVSLIDTGDSQSDRKIIRLLNDGDYSLTMTGTESGKVQYKIAFTDGSGNFNDTRTFNDIKVKEGTIIKTNPKQKYSVTLDADYNGNGRNDSRYKAKANSEAKKVSFVLLGIGITALVIFILVIVFMLLFGDKIKRKERLGSGFGG